MPIRLALLDDHQIVIDGLKLLLSGRNDIEVIEDFTKGRDLLLWLRSNSVDIVMTDIIMPDMDGYDVAIALKKEYPTIRIIALSMNGEGELIEKMIEEAEVSAYLLKTTDRDELMTAIQAVWEGDTYFAKEILYELNQYKKLKREN